MKEEMIPPRYTVMPNKLEYIKPADTAWCLAYLAKSWREVRKATTNH